MTPPSHPNRLALYAARAVGLGVGASAALGAGLAAGSAWIGLAVGCVLGLIAAAIAYGAVYRRIAPRLDLARSVLRSARKRRFEALADLPEQRAEHDELDVLLWQVARAGHTLQDEIERLRRLETYRRDFLGDVSHELRTPIFAVSGFAETLLDGALEDESVRHRFVERILSNSRRLEALTRDLAEISKLETGRLSLDCQPFDIAALAGEAVESLGRLASERGVSLSVRAPGDLPDVLADQDRIQQVITNLVENAIRYNEPGGRVEVVARLLHPSGDAPSVRLSVVDNGIGIPEHAIARLTERFYRVDTSRSREQGGTGLGLAIVKHILEAHGQEMLIESRPGYGSTFAFSLDLAGSPPRQSPRQADLAVPSRERA